MQDAFKLLETQLAGRPDCKEKLARATKCVIKQSLKVGCAVSIPTLRHIEDAAMCFAVLCCAVQCF